MTKIHNLDAVPNKFIDDPRFESAMSTKYLGALAGSERIYVNIDSVKPGAKSAKYHSHTLQEEFFLILKGSGTLRIQNATFPVKHGDFLAKPAGKGISHQFINDGTEILEILDCGTNDKNDMVEYPDENMLLVKTKNAVFSLDLDVNEWSVDPNE
ncbi:MAG: cupin domain-containing protein [Candidatus Marinimicrobia bacterium]|nr:cupin domain-containing protein [Candidatus Neomarinimicrobiota bacterium]